jgi:hypothetical protein
LLVIGLADTHREQLTKEQERVSTLSREVDELRKEYREVVTFNRLANLGFKPCFCRISEATKGCKLVFIVQRKRGIE